MTIETLQDAQFVADKIRDGTLTGARKEQAFTMLQEFRAAPERTESEQLGFLERAGKALDARRAIMTDIVTEVVEGEQQVATGIFDVMGSVGAGAALDMLGEVAVSAGRGLEQMHPEVVGAVKKGATWAWFELMNTDIGQKGLTEARKGMQAWNTFKTGNPIAARHIEAGTNIAILAMPPKARPKAPQTRIGASADTLSAKATAQAAVNRNTYIDDLVQPERTVNVAKQQVPRTTEQGFFRTKTVELSKAEREIAREVTKVKAVTPRRTLQGNYNVLQRSVAKEAARLKTQMQKKGNFRFSPDEFRAELVGVLATLKNNPLIVGDAALTAKKIIIKMDDLVKKNGYTGAALLKSRKQLDKWARAQKGDKIFDPNLENAMSIALREVRTSSNEFLIARATNVGVRKSLRKQHLLLKGMDNIVPKAAKEYNNMLTRLWQRSMRLLPIRGEFNQVMATLFGVGGLGASAQFAPVFTKLALGTGATLVGYRVLTGPAGKKAVAQLLRGTDRMIRNTKDANLIRELRADRALLVELLQKIDLEEQSP